MSIDLSNSFLFGGGGFNSGTSVGGSNFLADYASIKNGSYYKLMKAYYAKTDAEDSKTSSSNSTSKDGTKTLATLKTETDALQKSADALTTKGSKSLFKKKEVTKTDEDGNETTSMEYDKDAIYKGVKSFVDDYNSLIDSAGKANSTSVLRQAVNLTKTTNSYSGLLERAGITVGSDNKLTIDEKSFKEADISTVKSLFNGNSSYAGMVSDRASILENAANKEASKANTYNAFGGYSNPYSSGNIYNSFF